MKLIFPRWHQYQFSIRSELRKWKLVLVTSELLWWLIGKESACKAGDIGVIPGLGRSPREGNGNPLQYSCLETPLDRGAWWATVHGGCKKSQTWLVTKQQKRMIISDKPQYLCAHLMKGKFPAFSLLLEVCYQINVSHTQKWETWYFCGCFQLGLAFPYCCQLRTRASELLRDFVLSCFFSLLFCKPILLSFLFIPFPSQTPSVLSFSLIFIEDQLWLVHVIIPLQHTQKQQKLNAKKRV